MPGPEPVLVFPGADGRPRKVTESQYRRETQQQSNVREIQAYFKDAVCVTTNSHGVKGAYRVERNNQLLGTGFGIPLPLSTYDNLDWRARFPPKKTYDQYQQEKAVYEKRKAAQAEAQRKSDEAEAVIREAWRETFKGVAATAARCAAESPAHYDEQHFVTIRGTFDKQHLARACEQRNQRFRDEAAERAREAERLARLALEEAERKAQAAAVAVARAEREARERVEAKQALAERKALEKAKAEAKKAARDQRAADEAAREAARCKAASDEKKRLKAEKKAKKRAELPVAAEQRRLAEQREQDAKDQAERIAKAKAQLLNRELVRHK